MQLVAALAEHAHLLPPHLAERVRRAHVAIARGCSIEVALGVDRARRDQALRRVAELVAPGASPWVASGVVLRAVAAFERHQGDPRTEVEHVLQVALDSAPIPGRKQLARALDIGPEKCPSGVTRMTPPKP